MRLRWGGAMVLGIGAVAVAAMLHGKTPTENAKGDKIPTGTFFRTSDRCMACHNGLTTSSGEDISIGFEWRASIMANSSRDPFPRSLLARKRAARVDGSSRVEAGDRG